jgi:hypothetical protein
MANFEDLVHFDKSLDPPKERKTRKTVLVLGATAHRFWSNQTHQPHVQRNEGRQFSFPNDRGERGR